jgi:hypothetical protein
VIEHAGPPTRGSDPKRGPLVTSELRHAEQRERNLRIGAKGIVDFGNGEKFSPIDLVLRALN